MRILALSVLLVSVQAHAFAPFAEVRAHYARSEGVLLDRNGEVLHEVRVDKKARRLEWVPLPLVSQALKDAVIFSEDRRFEEHSGVDWRALIKAAGQNLFSKKKRGASTISMQVTSFLAEEHLGHRRGIGEKLKQMRSALDLERSWTKDQILETYLNFVSFRGELQGVGAAAQGLFGKAAHGLNVDESLLLAALIRSPEASPAQVEHRACELAKAMKLAGDCASISALVAGSALRTGFIRPAVALAPHVAQRLLKRWSAPFGSETPDFRTSIRTTIDRKLQAFVSDTLKRHILSIRDRNVNDAAALVLDNATGEVLAYVGGLDELSSARHVDGVQARRQAGSTLKPFLYGLAIERKYLTAASLIDDAPTDIPVFGGIYRPRNYDKEFHGPVSVRTALASSLNVPAVRTLALIGVDSFVRELEAFGFEGLQSPEYYGPSLALGSADISLWDLTNAYRALAEGGVWSPAHLTPESSPSHRALSPEAAFIVSNMLSDRESRALTFGLENPLSSRFWTAAKTGTSKDMRDNWCIGYSRRYTVGIWVGNFSGTPMWNVSGISGAGPSWADIMNELHAHLGSAEPKAPSSVVQARGEWFVAGTELGMSQRQEGWALGMRHEAGARPRITYPAPGTIIAHDPDIPPSRERVVFEAVDAHGLTLQLNGKTLGAAPYFWKPEAPGRYELTLVNSAGAVQDSVKFRVRGNVTAADDEIDPPAPTQEPGTAPVAKPADKDDDDDDEDDKPAAKPVAPKASVTDEEDDDDTPDPRKVEGNIAIVSDYLEHGLSQTAHEPAVQGGFDWAHPLGISLGVWGSNVKTPTRGSSNLETAIEDGFSEDASQLELDFTGAYRRQLSENWALSLGIVYYTYWGDGAAENGVQVPLRLEFKHFHGELEGGVVHHGHHVSLGWVDKVRWQTELDVGAAYNWYAEGTHFADLHLGLAHDLLDLEWKLLLSVITDHDLSQTEGNPRLVLSVAKAF